MIKTFRLRGEAKLQQGEITLKGGTVVTIYCMDLESKRLRTAKMVGYNKRIAPINGRVNFYECQTTSGRSPEVGKLNNKI